MFADHQATNTSRPPRLRSRISNGKPALGRRTAVGRRCADVADSYAEALGGWPRLTDLQRAQVRKLAELATIAEERRLAVLRGSPLDASALVALENLVMKAARDLGLPSPKGSA